MPCGQFVGCAEHSFRELVLNSNTHSALQLLDAGAYRRAFLQIEPLIGERQLNMLLGHAMAPGATLSMRGIASLGQYDSYVAANLQYGRLGRLFADALGLQGLPNQTMAMADGAPSGDQRGHFTWTLRAPLVQALHELGLVDLFEKPGAGVGQNITDSTSREAVVLARRGQGVYRQQVMHLWQARCAVSGCSVSAVLIASHAKPWASSTDEERLDPYNGLLLAASVDRLFDQGLISFNDDGRLLCEDLEETELHALGLSRASKLRFIAPRHLPFLAAHRAAHGFKSPTEAPVEPSRSASRHR